MRESLERVGRFDPQRARDRFLAAFEPACTRHVLVDGERVGFVVVRSSGDGCCLLDHLVRRCPVAQAPRHSAPRRAGRCVSPDADACRLTVRVGALRESAAEPVLTARLASSYVDSQAEWDNALPLPGGRCG